MSMLVACGQICYPHTIENIKNKVLEIATAYGIQKKVNFLSNF